MMTRRVTSTGVTLRLVEPLAEAEQAFREAGVTITFPEGTYVEGDTFRFTMTPPQPKPKGNRRQRRAAAARARNKRN